MNGSRVTLPGDVPSASSYAAIPPSFTRGVVVIHEIFGPQPEIERVVQRFARAGYAAVAPDLLADGPKPLCIARAMAATELGRGPQIDQIYRAREWLCAETGLEPKSVGLIGFCLGGGFALAAGAGWGAVSTNYGYIPPARLLKQLAPTIGCYGGRDRLFGKTAAKLEARLHQAGVCVETHTFPKVGHSFLTDGDYKVPAAWSGSMIYTDYDPESAEEGWRRILAFFERHIAPREVLAAAM